MSKVIDEEDVDFDKDFNQVLAQERHRELTRAVKAITTATEGIGKLINMQTSAIKGYADAVKGQPEPKVSVTVDNNKSEESIKQLGIDIARSLGEVKDQLISYQKPKEWNFKVHRDRQGLIEEVTATIKK